MIHVIAIITTKPGQRTTVLDAFKANMPAVHAEQGCIEYRPVIDAEGAGSMQTEIGPDTFSDSESFNQGSQFNSLEMKIKLFFRQEL